MEQNKVEKKKSKKNICDDPKKYFFSNDGQIIKSLSSLLDAFLNMSDKTYNYHVNSEKNDFANWIFHVFSEEKLSEKILDAKTRIDANRILKEFLEEEKKKEMQTEEQTADEQVTFHEPRKTAIIKNALSFQTILLDKLKWINLNRIAGFYLAKVKNMVSTHSARFPKSNTYHLKMTFQLHSIDSGKKIGIYKRRGFDTASCESYLNKIHEKIIGLNVDSTEKEAIELIHLFYCLDEEISALSDKSNALLVSFKKRYEELKNALIYLKKKGKDVSRCEEYLSLLPKKMNVFEDTKKESAAIEVLHTFYCLEGALKDLRKEKS